jgi:hypothetical protein
MESIATLENGQMVYRDAEGNELYKRGEDENYGMKGTLLPRSNRTDEGGSTGFDISQPMPIIVDPDQPERHIKLPKVKEAEQVAEPVATASYMPETIEDYTEDIQPTPPNVWQEPHMEQPVESAIPVVKEGPKAPACRITFDLGETVGEFECFYHRIFKDGVCLVLVWDNRYHGSRYNPSSKLRDAVDVYVGKERDCYNVLIGPRFTDDFRSEEYLVLFIKGDDSGKER